MTSQDTIGRPTAGPRPARPSLRHAIAAAAIRPFGLGPRTAPALHAALRRRDARWRAPTPPARAVRGLAVSWSDEIGWPVWTLSPAHRSGASRRAVVAVHGGAYTAEILSMQWSLYASFVRTADVEVVVPIYPLAPHGTASTVVPVLADLIDAETGRRGAERVGVEGDSAGAGLAMAALQELVRRRRPVPSRAVLISPWLDATLADPRSRLVDDPLLSVETLIEAGRLWAGDLDPADPRVSPVNGDLHGLPSMTVYAGSRDVLYPDTLRLRDRTAAEDVDATFDLRPGLMHGWAGLGFLPEARAVRRDLVDRLVGADAPDAPDGP